VGLGGIVVTHRIAGPIFKMKRLLRELGEGYLRMPTPLRKGDDLQDFFEEFARTVDRLRERKSGELDQLNRILAELEEVPGEARTPAAVHAIQGLRTLREHMSSSVRTMPPGA
jgi:hypothetical protein